MDKELATKIKDSTSTTDHLTPHEVASKKNTSSESQEVPVSKSIHIASENLYSVSGVIMTKFSSYVNGLHPMFSTCLRIQTDMHSAVHNFFKDLDPAHQYVADGYETAIYFANGVYIYVGDRPLSILKSDNYPVDLVIHVAGTNKKTVDSLTEEIFNAFPVYEAPKTEENKIQIDFWSYNRQEPEYPKTTHRELYAESHDEISLNYNEAVLSSTNELFKKDFRPSNGKLLLWHGVPGTGKTYFIRALCQAWKEWCDFCYIVDSEEFFSDAAYMNAAMLNSRDPNRWNLLVIEDAAELISSTANKESGKGLSRLLNLTEGMIGQGLNLMVMITTNEDIGELHPAVSRPGRCLNSTEFKSLSSKEANAVLKNIGSKTTVEKGKELTLAEIYALHIKPEK